MEKKTVSTGTLALLLISMLTLAFNIQQVKATETIYIRPDGEVDPPTAPILRDGDLYTLTGDILSGADGIVIERDNMTLDGAGYTLQGTGSGRGIDLSHRSNITVKSTIVTDFLYGIYLNSSVHSILVGNNASNNYRGIMLSFSRNISITGNTAYSNNAHGIYLGSSNSNSITGNTAFASNLAPGIYLRSSSNNSITGNNASKSWSGIYSWESSNNNVLVGNNASNNDIYGICLMFSSNNILTGNTASNNDRGIHLGFSVGSSSNNTLTGNTASNNDIYGIFVGSSSNNTLTGNTASNNTCGIYFWESSNNSLFHDNFKDNPQQVYDDSRAAGYPSVNNWAAGYPSGGNYWSDYNGTDLYSGLYQNETGSDGIGDTPYIIDENNKDNYPLIHPYESVRNLNTSLVYLTIQSAIDATETLDGHTIFVKAGTYYENVVINKSLTLIGENKSNTIVDGNLTDNVISLATNNINVRRFTMCRGGSWNSGVYIGFRSCNNTIADCLVSNNYHGIYLYTESCNNKIINNVVTGNYPYGIFTRRSYNNNVANNTFSLNDDGIYLYTSWNNSIVRNYLIDNSAGILLGKGETRSNFVVNNHMAYNDVGILLHGGPQDNRIYHNYFLNNTIQASIGYPSRANNWDDGYPSGGNYWSDYEERYPDATELDDSGIWDTPYVIDETNQDNYPLMEPWTPKPPIPTTIEELKTEIEELYAEDEIDNQGIVTSLLAKLDVAQKLIDDGKIDQAKNMLTAFINEVQDQSGKHITPEAAELLIESAEYIISNL